jgi:hypothetical protein
MPMKSATVFLLLVAGVPAAAANYVLVDGNTSARINDRNGATVWRVAPEGDEPAGASDNLFISNYYFRVGDSGGEAPLLDALGAPTATATATSLRLSFSSAQIAATADWSLAGAGGGALATLTKSVMFTNLGNADLDLHLFDYTDFDILFNPLAQADSARLVSPGRIVTTSSTIPFSIDARADVAPDGYQISDFLTPYFQFFFDLDGPTTLLNTPAPGVRFPATPGDTAFAFQWNRVLAPGESFGVRQIARYVPTSAVPEPGTWAMMVAGFGIMGAVARRRRAAPVA